MKSLVNDQYKRGKQPLTGSKSGPDTEELRKANEELKIKNKKLAEKLALQKLEVDKIKNSESQYKSLLDNTSAFVILDNELQIEETSAGALVLNKGLETGKDLLKCFRFQEEKQFLDAFGVALQGQKPPVQFIAYKTAKTTNSDKFLIRLDTLKPGFLVAVFIQKLAADLQFDLTKLSWLATKTHNGVIITDANGSIEWVNNGYCQITGYKITECIGEKPFYLSKDFNYAGFDKRILQMISAGKKFTGETVSYKKNGTIYWLHLDVSPVFNENEELINYVIIETDITDKKETEEKLLSSAKRSINILESITDAMFIINSEWKFTYLNKQAEILLNEKKENLLGKKIWDELAFSQSSKMREQFHQAFNKQIDIHFEEYIEPSQQWFEVHGYVSTEGLSIYLRSIQSRKISEEKLRDKNEELVKINNELDNFVYRAAHDLRAPLASVLGLINISKIENDQTKKNEYLNKMTDCINKLDNFINKIIHYSRNSRLVINYEKLDFNKIFEEIFTHLQYFEGADNITKELVIDDQTPFYSDPIRIKDALQNLLVNAVQYQKTYVDDQFIKISVETSYSKAKIVVQDNGNGIHDDHKDKVFKMFYRASEQSNGSGLGLYIVKEIIKKLGGTIKLSTQLKKGSTFTIEIPNGR